MKPLISVIIPTYNRERLLVEAIDSVMRQTLADFELIVVDDGSQDDTRRAVTQHKDDRIHYLYQCNAGVSAARNLGASKSHGRYLIFLDSDDLLLPTGLDALYRAASDGAEIGLVGGGFDCVDHGGLILGTARLWEVSDRLDSSRWILSCPFIPSATLVSRQWFDMVGGFRDPVKYTEDWDLWLRLSLAGCPMGWVRETVSQYRLHPGTRASDHERKKGEDLRVLESAFARKDLPYETASLRSRAVSGVLVHVSACQYADGDLDLANRNLLAAAEIAPDLVVSGELLELLLRKGESPIVTRDSERYRATIKANLPDELRKRNLVRRAEARESASRLFSAHQARDRASTRLLWWQTVSRDPRWLENIGMWSIFLEATMGKRFADRLRRLRRRVSQASNMSVDPCTKASDPEADQRGS